MKVTVIIHRREEDDERLEFNKPASLVFGRSEKAQCPIVNDPYVSRFHFMLFINPSEVRLRNLSTTNGTLVDGILRTGRGSMPDAIEAEMLMKDVTDPDGADVVLRNGSKIEVGYTTVTVEIETPIYCVNCGQPFADGVGPDSTPMCDRCWSKYWVNSATDVSKVRKHLAGDVGGIASARSQNRRQILK